MNKLLLLVICLLAFPLFAQESETIPEFHRLLVFNDENQLMVVKIKNTNFWVTPGVYNTNKALTNNNLHKLAAEYGITITSPDLRGVFTLQNKKTNKSSNRHFFNVKVNGGNIEKPESIEEIKWLSLNEAMQLITFPHINMLLNQTANYPKVVWGGTILRYKEGDILKSKMVKVFFPLNKQN